MKSITPMKAIRLKCLDCVNNQIQEINRCHIKGCPLWVYRTGHRPKADHRSNIDGLNINCGTMNVE